MLASYWDKAGKIGQAVKELGTKSVRKIAQATGVSKRAAHRHMKALDKRNQHPESVLWESSMGQLWLVRLVSATIFPPRGREAQPFWHPARSRSRNH